VTTSLLFNPLVLANVRINALTTTATSAANDDYLAINGTTNGTRKILGSSFALLSNPLRARLPARWAR
jgi:hypothetical protein